MSYLRCLCLLAHSGVHTYCVVVLVCFSSSCEPYVSLECPFLIPPSAICNICLMETDHKDNYSQEIIQHITFLMCTRVTNDLGIYS